MTRPIWFAQAEDFGRMRQVFNQAGFDERGIAAALGLPNLSGFREDDLPWILHRTGGEKPVETLVRLFLISHPVTPAAAEQALAPFTLDSLQQAGLIRVEASQVVPLVRITPYKGLLFASDIPGAQRQEMREDFVMGVGKSSHTLANLMVLSGKTVLDLGTGSGVLGLLTAPHSQTVVAADRNPRAVAMTEFNAQLNGMTNVEPVVGDLFQPLAGRTFDLIITNPPFVISPKAKFTFRDSGMHGDQITQRIVREAPQYLTEGGYCQILCNWAHEAGQSTAERLSTWFEGTGCDVWVLCHETADPATYASTWIRHTESHDPQQYAEKFTEWMDYYAAENITAISGGVIMMRRKTGDNWIKFQEVDFKMLGPCGEFVERGFKVHDYLLSHAEPATLLADAFRLSPDVRLLQNCQPQPDGWAIAESHISLTRGFAFSGGCDPFLANLLVRCQGTTPLFELLVQTAQEAEMDADQLIKNAFPIVQQLVTQGFLLPPNIQ